jgi:hypothetical protein
MVDARDIRDDAGTPGGQAQEAKRAQVLEQKRGELVEFRNAGVLTEAEFEEQNAKLRWGIP